MEELSVPATFCSWTWLRTVPPIELSEATTVDERLVNGASASQLEKEIRGGAQIEFAVFTFIGAIDVCDVVVLEKCMADYLHRRILILLSTLMEQLIPDWIGR